MSTLYVSKRIGNVVHVAPARATGRCHARPDANRRDGRLMLRCEAGAKFHTLCGERLELGELVELQRWDGSWLQGRYDWNDRQNGRPLLVLDDRSLELMSDDTLRWPKRD